MIKFWICRRGFIAAFLVAAIAGCDSHGAVDEHASTAATSAELSSLNGPCFPDSRDTRSCSEIITSRYSTSKDVAYAFNARGAAYGNNDDYDRAFRNFEQAIRYYRRDGKFFYNRGNVYRIKNDFGHAIADFNTAQALGYSRSRLYYARAAAYNANGDRQQAYVDLLEFRQRTQPAQRSAAMNSLLKEYGL